MTNRASLLERAQELGAIGSSQQEDLLKFTIGHGQADKALAVFDRMFKQSNGWAVSTQLPPGAAAVPGIPGRYLSMLAAKQMDWERHLLLVRAAHFENRSIQKTATYLQQLQPDKIAETLQISPIVYPLSAPAEGLLDRLVKTSRQWLAASEWTGSPNNPWEVCIKPRLVWNDEQQTIEIESMLDVLWPLDMNVSPECHARLLSAAVEWGKQLDTFGPWQTLGLHNLAARLQDEDLVARAQQRLIELSKNKQGVADRAWLMACWSAVVSSAKMPAVATSCFHLGEIVREGALNPNGTNDKFYLAMTLDQLRRCGGDQASIAKDVANLKSMMRGNDAKSALRSSRLNATLEAVSPRVKVNLYLFDEMIKQGRSNLALSILDSMREQGWITGYKNGVYIPVGTDLGSTTIAPAFDLRSAFQSVMQEKQGSRQLQTLLQELLLNENPAPQIRSDVQHHLRIKLARLASLCGKMNLMSINLCPICLWNKLRMAY